jgi:hypothetical protein
LRLARSTGAGGGLLIVVLGIWGIFIPFVGPYFHYGFSPDTAWHFSSNRLWLDILPGVAAALGGLALIVSERRARGVAGGWLALMGGVWFLLGPSISLLWSHATGGPLHSGIGSPLGGHDRAALEFIGVFYGLGALITAFSALAIGRFASRPGVVDRPPNAPVSAPQSESESPIRRQDAGSQPQQDGA